MEGQTTEFGNDAVSPAAPPGIPLPEIKTADSAPFAANAIFAINPDVVSATMQGEEILLHLTTGVYFGLDEVGARIWALLSEPCTASAIERVLLTEYDVQPDRCRADLQALLAQLLEAQLIEVHDA